MLIIFTAIAFSYAYLSYQVNEMSSFYIALAMGIIFIGFMLNNIIKVMRMKNKKKE